METFLKQKQFLNNQNIDLFVVIFPWPFEIANEKPRQNYTNYVTKKLTENSIKYISAYEPFLEGNIYTNITTNYIYNDMHFNANGYKKISEIIATKLN